MTNIKELSQQIAKVDAWLQAAYKENNLEDIILFSGLRVKLEARFREATPENKPVKVQAWKHTCLNEAMLESRILARDEYMTIDN